MSPQKTPQSLYRFPESGFISNLPARWVPYAELARIDKPVACLYLYFPCIFGTLLAALISEPMISPTRLLLVNAILFIGSFWVRCAGCTWNDIVDQDLDRKVIRTQLRPMVRRAMPTSNAVIFTIFQVLTGLGMAWLTLPTRCLYYCVPSIILTGLYPYGKRFTHYPQLILGSVFSWGVIMAFPAFDVDLISSAEAIIAAGYLYFSCIAWTMSYDTIYAAQDVKDDLTAGIKSPVVRHQGYTRVLLAGAVFTQIALLCCTGIAMEASPVYFVSTCFGTALVLGTMVSRVDLNEPNDCIWWFKKGCFYTGAITSSGFIAEYVVRVNQ